MICLYTLELPEYGGNNLGPLARPSLSGLHKAAWDGLDLCI